MDIRLIAKACHEANKVYCESIGDDTQPSWENAPEWQKESVAKAKKVLADSDFIELPDQFEIHEYSIMERFCFSVSDERVQNALLRAIKGRGAFRHFKDRIFEEGVQEDWFAFREKAFKRIAADFLESQGIAFIDEQ